jgi:hypothetical protein
VAGVNFDQCKHTNDYLQVRVKKGRKCGCIKRSERNSLIECQYPGGKVQCKANKMETKLLTGQHIVNITVYKLPEAVDNLVPVFGTRGDLLHVSNGKSPA